MKIAITGASGFVASHVIEKYRSVVKINRNDSVEEIVEKLQDVDVVFNLAGAPIIKRWTPSYKKILLSSRIDTTKTLVEAINQSDIKHFISTSAVGIYPDAMACHENSNIYGDDFLAEVCRLWEDEANRSNKPTAIVRFGVILSKKQGALAQMLPPFKLGVGGVIGDGKMMMSWIDIDDLIGIYEHIIDNKLTGIYNATTPQPVSNYNFTKTLGEILNRPTIFPLPEFVLKLLYGEGSKVLTGSKKIYPEAIVNSGYKFLYPTIKSSLEHQLGD